MLLVVVRRRLARHGFQATVAWATTPSRRARERSVDEGRAVAELAAAQARRVFRWHPVANKCLEQSLLLCRFLGRRGVKAELVMAVRKYPFESHAWARLGDLPLTDPPESHPEHFRVVARF